MFKFPKTPHINPLNHARNLLGYFVTAAAVVVFAGVGVEVTGSPIIAAVGAALAGGVGMVGGLLATMVFRATFGLIQTGRIAQYTGFWLASLLGLKSAALLFGGTLALSNPLLASLALFGLAFGSATALGEVPWRGRSWLPIRRKA